MMEDITEAISAAAAESNAAAEEGAHSASPEASPSIYVMERRAMSFSILGLLIT